MLKAAEHFDLHQVNPVKVSRRNGVNFVFNGQHTIEIVALVSGSRDTPVWCMVYEDLDYELEADIFANQQKYNDQTLSDLTEDSLQLTIDQMIESSANE